MLHLYRLNVSMRSGRPIRLDLCGTFGSVAECEEYLDSCFNDDPFEELVTFLAIDDCQVVYPVYSFAKRKCV